MASSIFYIASLGPSLTPKTSKPIDSDFPLQRKSTVSQLVECANVGSLGEDEHQGPPRQALTALGLEVEEEEEVDQPCNTVLLSACMGPALKASYAGRSEEFCDGFGLCSPGRCHPNYRSKKLQPDQLRLCRRLRELVDGFW